MAIFSLEDVGPELSVEHIVETQVGICLEDNLVKGAVDIPDVRFVL